jgi:hypothetical protein
MTFLSLLSNPSLKAVFVDGEALNYFSDRAITFLHSTDNLLTKIYGIRFHFWPTFAMLYCLLSGCKPL